MLNRVERLIRGRKQEVVATAAPERTVLVLGGGAMKGVAHIGAWKALDEAGIRPDAIVGTSIGAVVGACIAGGMGWRDLSEMARALRKEDIVGINRRALWFGGVREQAVLDPDPFRLWLAETLPANRFSDLGLPLRINAVSLKSGREVWFGDGVRAEVSVHEAVYASAALPVYFPPARIDGDLLVDGGVIDSFAIEQARDWGATRVVGIDVGADLTPPRPDYFDKGMVAIHDRVFSLSARHRRERGLAEWSGPELLYIRPKVGHLDGWDFDRTPFLLEEGYRATKEALAEVRVA
jgi:NTE family protein